MDVAPKEKAPEPIEWRRARDREPWWREGFNIRCACINQEIRARPVPEQDSDVCWN
jgi:hypothetical protein